ncbi:MAG TPA: GGDEF domain-containing protein [Vicinamibacterales bacterium]
MDIIAADAVAIFPQLANPVVADDGADGIAAAVAALVAWAVRRGRVEVDDSEIAALRALAAERAVSLEDLVTLAYHVERSMIDEMALDPDLGVSTEAWPGTTQLIRRGAFDCLGALAAQSASEAGHAALVDRLTTVHTRPLFDIVLTKEADRAGRFGYALALVVFDVDRLAELNDRHGRVIGDRILERLGVLIRQYFRQHDWVARHGNDSVEVLLTRSDADHADELADKVRATVEERLSFTDHRTNDRVAVTISAGVVHFGGAAGTLVDPEQLRLDAETALRRAKELGRNRVVRVEGAASASRALPRNSP